jgi:CheY-like chemotaxis protein
MEQKTFLLADDDIDDREMFCEALGSIDEHIVCHTVADGKEALTTLEQQSDLPALIFLDVNMPVMNGWQCLQKLNEHKRYSTIPVIVMSTSSHQREIDIARQFRALCYLTKPHDYNDLIQVLQTIVANTGPALAPALRELELKGSPYVRTLTH